MVIADTGPLNYLILLGQIELLQTHYGRIAIPGAVASELKHRKAPAAVQKWIANPPHWTEIVSAKHLDETLSADLGSGEREAISLAIEIPGSVLLIDDQGARTEALLRNLEVTGTLGVLLRESWRSDLDFPALLRRVRTLGFRLSLATENRMIKLYDSSRR